MQKIADGRGAALVINPINERALPLFLRGDVQTKTSTMKGRTSREGLAAGFLEAGDGLEKKPLSFEVGGDLYFGFRKGTLEGLTKDPNDQDLIQIAVDHKGLMIVSDIDLVAIHIRKKPSADLLLNNSPFGFVTKEEEEILLALNETFQKAVQLLFAQADPPPIQIVSHGTVVRFPGSSLRYLHFPLTFYTPFSPPVEISDIDEMKKKFVGLRAEGFQISWNEQWGPL
jgi:hypothetical protein